MVMGKIIKLLIFKLHFNKFLKLKNNNHFFKFFFLKPVEKNGLPLTGLTKIG